MDTCIRGFSFMPENLETSDLKLVDGEALQETWKVSRRQRVKQQEQRIWDEFVQERDVVTNICKDDPYQFIEQLSEEKIKELLDIELEKMKKERLEEEIQIKEISPKKEVDHVPQEQNDNQCVVLINESKTENDTFHIFDDKEDTSGISGPDDEVLNDSLSPPCTVRERLSPKPDCLFNSPEKDSSKSSENLTGMIESSIYCAKVKELRIKMAAEFDDIAVVLERQNILNIEPADLPKMMRRAVEFTSRFNRINMYQLHRQLQDIKRNDSQAMPFAKYTQFQSQLVRIVSIHQNALRSLQVFMKSFPQTLCIRESGEALRTLASLVRDITDVCTALDAPPGLVAAHRLYQDSLPNATDKLLNAIEDYTNRMTEYLNSTENTSVSCSRRSKKLRRGRKSIGSCSKSGKSFGDTDAQLSMYSLDTLRRPSNVKASSSKINYGGTSKKRGCLNGRSKGSVENSSHAPRRKKSPRSRRPLMRDPQAGAPKPKRKTDKDLDVPTLVETVAPCESSYISRDTSPTLKDLISTKGKESPRSPKKVTKRLKKERSPRKRSRSPKMGQKSTGGGKPPVNSDKHLDGKEIDKDPSESSKGPVLRLEAETTMNNKEMSYKDAEKPKNEIEIPKKETETPKKVTDVAKKDTGTLTKLKDSHRRGTIMPKKEITPRRNLSPRNEAEKRQSITPRRDTPRNQSLSPRQEKVILEEPIPPEKLRSPRTPRIVNMGEGERELEEKVKDTPKKEEQSNRERRASAVGGCELMTLLRQLCGGDSPGMRNERVSGVKNGQLICVTSGSPRQPSTPQLLRILEETIQKKPPRATCGSACGPVPVARSLERCRMALNVDDKAAERLFNYRTAFLQHMLSSPLYANSAVGKPWEVIGRVSERIIDDLLLGCAEEMQLQSLVRVMYKNETS